jgi:hypothetical protein
MSTSKATMFLISLILFSFNFSSITAAGSNIRKTVKKNRNSIAEAKKAEVRCDENDTLRKILKGDYPTFVKNLGENVNDAKFRAAIRSLSSKKKVNSRFLDAPVANLIPTQNEIDVDKSLKWSLKSPESARDFLFCKTPIKINGLTIVSSANGKFVIDGHHRWSQVYSLNPNCKMSSVDLTDIKDPINALKSTQLGIAAGTDKNGKEIDKIPVSIVEGRNLLKISEADLKAYVVQNLADNVLAVFKEFNASIDTKEKVADYIWQNVSRMQKNNQPVPGAPGRSVMPQTDMAPNWVANTVNTDHLLSADGHSIAGFTFSKLSAVLILLFVILL